MSRAANFLGSFFRYLYRIRKELIVGPIFAYLYFFHCWEGKYSVPLPRLSFYGFTPYFTFGLRNQGTTSRRNTYLEGLWRVYEDSSKFDLFTPPVEDLQFEGSNFTYITPTRYPEQNSWSPGMRTFIDYNLNNNPELVGNDKKIFQYAVNEIDNIAEYSSKWLRRLCHKYEQATIPRRSTADFLSWGFFRMDSAFALPNDHNSTKVVCKLVWDIKEITLMSKYHLYRPNAMLMDHLREMRQIMEWLDNAQELPKYYDSPDWNLGGRVGGDFLRFEQFIQTKLPDLEGIRYNQDGPNWVPFHTQKFTHADGRLLKLASGRTYQNGTQFLHEGENAARSFWGQQKANNYIERFFLYEEMDVNDQNRFNYGHRPREKEGYGRLDMSFTWEKSYCPWGSDGELQKQVETLEEWLEFEKLALESFYSGDSQSCIGYKYEKVNGESIRPTIHMTPEYYGYIAQTDINACQLGGAFGPESPGYYMDLLRESFPFNDDCYRRAQMAAQCLEFGSLKDIVWAYMNRWNWHDHSQQGIYEFWLALVILPGLLCGNHRGKVEKRLNKIHD